MNGMVVGVMMLVSSMGGTSLETSRPNLVLPALTSELLVDTTMSRSARHDVLNDRSGQQWQRGPVSPSQARSSKRFSKTERIIGVAVGAFGGFYLGGAIGYYATQCKNCDDDGTSGLKGVVIGAPIGAVVGAILGYRWTN